MTALAEADVAAWFMEAHPAPERLEAEWRERPFWTAQLPVDKVWSVVAMPTDLGVDVFSILDTMLGAWQAPVLVDRLHRRYYFFTEPDPVGVGESRDVWTLSPRTWLTVPHPIHGPYDCRTVWRRPPWRERSLLSVADLANAIRLAGPAHRYRREAAGPGTRSAR
ncbi:hypothetical protein [Streptomyces subrutilus]|uniref:Uncharacterized protein n=1 Tax=Streptomyces subrutilus TaxID=36818 RepID=A0A1E5NXF9_9ACTN|nr:hypothetical protein [Streptomyces subrutilus]OEJ20888.1 hypothetical protein BGK67_35215 [Streptomyces subrutilus]